MVAKATANIPRIVVEVLLSPAAISAPTIQIPDIAFEPDIRGVCSVGGTLAITSNPINIASIKIYKIIKNSPNVICYLLLGVPAARPYNQ